MPTLFVGYEGSHCEVDTDEYLLCLYVMKAPIVR